VIVGFGSIGAAVAARLGPFGVAIVGVARSARDGVRGMDALDALLPGAAILVNLLPLTSQWMSSMPSCPGRRSS
jgi:phosphoglycerate dehydrogenase-like enzyme